MLSTRWRRNEDGQIIPVLLTAVIAILAVTVLLLQVGRAGLLRTRTQTAADAAALAALAEVEDQWAAALADGILPWEYGVDEAVMESAAEEYAHRNGGEVVAFSRYDGFGRYVVTVRVRSAEKLGGDLKEVQDERAHSKSTASIQFPDCYKHRIDLSPDDDEAGVRVRVLCGGEAIASWPPLGSPDDLSDDIDIEPQLVSDVPPELLNSNYVAGYSAQSFTYPDLPAAKGGYVTGDLVAERAKTWWEQGPIPYSMDDYFQGYRTDCSGFVSMAWGLKRSLTTESLPGVAHRISKEELHTGDILLWQNGPDVGHVVIFLHWIEGTHHQKYMAIHQTPPHTKLEPMPYPYEGIDDFVPYRYDNMRPSKQGV